MSFGFGYPGAFAAAAAVHASILFAGWAERGGAPEALPAGDRGAVEVELVAAALPATGPASALVPEAVAAPPQESLPEAPEPEATPEPKPSPALAEAPASLSTERVRPAAPVPPRAAVVKPAPKPVAGASSTGGGTAPGGALSGRAGDAPPGYVSNPRPAYPAESRRAGESGTVILRVEVDAAGRARSVSVARSCGFPRLDRAACEAVKRWRFRPAVRGGAKVAAAVNVPVRFDLR